MKAIIFVFAALTALPPVSGQLYLIQAEPTALGTGSYPVRLLSAGQDRSVHVVAELLPSGSEVDWVGVSHDARKAVLLSSPLSSSPNDKVPAHAAVVIDFDSASVVKRCVGILPPAGMGALPFAKWLSDIPGEGSALVEEYGTSDDTKLSSGHLLPSDFALRGMPLDPAVPCSQSLSVKPSDVKSMVLDGDSGPVSAFSAPVPIGKDGVPATTWFGGERTYFDWRVPETLMRPLADPFASVVVTNSQILGAYLGDLATRRWNLAFFRRSDNTWHVVPGASASGPYVRAFGSFVAITETLPKSAQNPESAGRSEWRKTATPAGPPTENALGKTTLGPHAFVLPGKLDLYDVDSEKMYAISTNQGDSEILLVDNGKVYYRVSDRLYSAAIGKDSLGSPTLLAQSESIRDVHWAFVKH